MGTAPQTQSWDQPSRRRTARRNLHVPIDAIVLRSGIPDTLPGRAVNLCEGGVAAVLAGELQLGEAVAVEILVPMAADPLHARAVVKHCTKLYSGMEFVALSPEQRTVIRNWTGTVTSAPPAAERTSISSEPPKSEQGGGRAPTRPRRGPGGWIWLVMLLALALAASAWWWNWNRGWSALEAGINKDETATVLHPQTQVSAEVMQKLVKHRVDPEYPAAARSKNLQAVIVLDVVVGPDGSVLDVHARNGPEVLAQAAMEAMRWWRFEPYRLDGQPVAVETTLAMEFNP
jgi:TonB family protein